MTRKQKILWFERLFGIEEDFKTVREDLKCVKDDEDDLYYIRGPNKNRLLTIYKYICLFEFSSLYS